jgi:hypothetical protein
MSRMEKYIKCAATYIAMSGKTKHGRENVNIYTQLIFT